MTIERIIVAAIVGCAVVYFAWRMYRMVTGKSGGSCGCSDCPAKTDNATQH